MPARAPRRSEDRVPGATRPTLAGAADTELLTIPEVAARWKVGYETVRRWCLKGAIAVVRVGPHSAIRIPRSEVERYEQREDV